MVIALHERLIQAGSFSAAKGATQRQQRGVYQLAQAKGTAMSALFPRSTPSFRARRPIRRESPFGVQRLSSSTTRGFDEYSLELFREPSARRGVLLLEWSHTRMAQAHSRSRAGERARLAAYESAYLAMASVLPLECCAEERHPSERLVATAGERLGLSVEDRALTEQMTGIYGLSGWETLDLDAVLEWCRRVQLAVSRHVFFCRFA